MDSQNRMLLILCGQKDFLPTLELEALTCLKRRIRISYEMKELTLADTEKYIKHNLGLAGLIRPLFPDDVVSQIYAVTKGNISEINKLCFNMINIAVSESKEIMELSILEKAC